MPAKVAEVVLPGLERVNLARDPYLQTGEHGIYADICPDIVHHGTLRRCSCESADARYLICANPVGIGTGPFDPLLSSQWTAQYSHLSLLRDQGKRQPQNFAQQFSEGNHGELVSKSKDFQRSEERRVGKEGRY